MGEIEDEEGSPSASITASFIIFSDSLSKAEQDSTD